MDGKGTFWPAALLGLSIAGIAHGADAYKCVDAKGAIAFQQGRCAPGVAQAEVKWRTQPLPADASHASGSVAGIDSVRFVVPVGPGVYRPSRPDEPGAIPWPLTSREVPRIPAPQFMPPSNVPNRPRGFECTTPAGHTFYRVDECPQTASEESVSTASRGTHDTIVSVKSREISNAEACDRMGRQSPMRHETVSSYDKRNGKDPCR